VNQEVGSQPLCAAAREGTSSVAAIAAPTTHRQPEGVDRTEFRLLATTARTSGPGRDGSNPAESMPD
jgi:hypothetical protein